MWTRSVQPFLRLLDINRKAKFIYRQIASQLDRQIDRGRGTLEITLTVPLSLCFFLFICSTWPEQYAVIQIFPIINIYLSIILSVYLPICLFVCLTICLSVYLFICLSVYLFICLSVYLSICLSVYLSICLSVYLSICLSVYLSILYLTLIINN